MNLDHDILALPESVLAYQREHGTTYQWKRLTVRGELESGYQARLIERGWRPVPLSRHPNSGIAAVQDQSAQAWVPDDIAEHYQDCIFRDGVILMEWTAEAEARARELEKLNAQSQLIRQFDRMGMTRQTDGLEPRQVFVANTNTFKWSCQEWLWFKTWYMLWKIGLPARWLLTKRERDIALRTGHTTWYRCYNAYATSKALLISEGRL